jgi:hypothetical protein
MVARHPDDRILVADSAYQFIRVRPIADGEGEYLQASWTPARASGQSGSTLVG